MKSVLCAGLVVFLGMSITAGCSGSRQPAVQQTAGMSNSELQDRVRAKLDTVPEVKQAHLFIDTDSDQKRVTLSGRLKSQELHDQAVSLAQSAIPGITVTDRIEVQPSELARTDAAGQKPKPAANAGEKSRKSRSR